MSAFGAVNGIYIHALREHWLQDPIRNEKRSVADMYRKAKDDFSKSLPATGSIDETLYQQVLQILQHENEYLSGEDDYLSVLEQFAKSMYNKKINLGGFETNLRELAFDKTTEEAIEALENIANSAVEWENMVENLKALREFFNRFGTANNAKGESLLLKLQYDKNIQLQTIDEYNSIKAALDRYDEAIAIANSRDVSALIQQLRKAGGTFVSNASGFVNEIGKVGKTAGVMTASKEVMENNIKGLSIDGVTVTGEGTSKYDYAGAISGTKAKTTFKGDTKINISYYFNGLKGEVDFLISEKASKISAHSYAANADNFRHGLVGGASYDYIFSGVEPDIQTLFCNFYIHEKVQKNSVITRYIAARAAANIIAGPAGKGRALFLREGTTIQPIEKFFTNALENENKMDKYITLKIEPPVSTIDNSRDPAGAHARVARVYNDIRKGVHFSATFGSREGF